MRNRVPTALISLTDVTGSAPRAVGTSMLVTPEEISGTIGGGALEWALIGAAREMLRAGDDHRTIEQALGPEIGQCCGGRVRATIERLTAASLSELPGESIRPAVYVFGAGHVGAAVAKALSLLPVSVQIIDQRSDLLSGLENYGRITETALPEAHVNAAPTRSAYVVTTHEHALDFMIVEAALRRGDAAYVGMIGSASKRAVLAKRLAAAGLSEEALFCPMGAGVSADKRPEIIAAAVVAEVVAHLF